MLIGRSFSRSEERGDSVRNCERQTYGLARFEKKRMYEKDDAKKTVRNYDIFYPGKPE
jgi:hypothetical protein